MKHGSRVKLMCRFEPSEVARQNEVAQGNIKPDDVVPILRKRTGPQGMPLVNNFRLVTLTRRRCGYQILRRRWSRLAPEVRSRRMVCPHCCPVDNADN